MIAEADRAREGGEWLRAAQLYRKVLDRNKRQPLVWVRYGDALKYAGAFAEAEKSYISALALDPSRADVYQLLGEVRRLQGRDKEANAAYLVGVALNPALLESSYKTSSFGWSEPQISVLRQMLGAPSASDSPVSGAGKYKGLDWLTSGQPAADDPDFIVSIRQFTAFNRKLFLSGSYEHRHNQVRMLFIIFSGGVLIYETTGEGRYSGEFNFVVDIPAAATYHMGLGFEFENGARFIIDQPTNGERDRESGHKIFAAFTEIVKSSRNSSILEIGSRARSGNIYKWFLPPEAEYIGFDVKQGENVSVVGDAHFLSTYFAKNYFDFIYSIAVFEHIMMPWKVAAEMNRVMKIGGMGFILSHQAWPLHEQPWDFWRFSDMGWHAIFNRLTGFEVVEAGLADRAYIVPVNFNSISYRMDEDPGSAYLGSVVLIRKVSESVVDWPVEPTDLMMSDYPG